jgi:hypothetical protein
VRELCPIFVLACLAAPPAFAEEGEPAAAREIVEWTSRRDLVGMTYEVWRNHSLGLRYMHAHEWGNRNKHHAIIGWVSYGLRPRVVLGRDRGNAVGGDLMGAASLFAHTGGAALELGVGALHGADGAVVVGTGGLFWSLLVFDIGYVLQMSPTRPDWLSPHQFAMRINIPFAQSHRRERVIQQHAESGPAEQRAGISRW